MLNQLIHVWHINTEKKSVEILAVLASNAMLLLLLYAVTA